MIAAGFRSVYKSGDSTLRGNLGAEIDAVFDVFDFDLAVVAPAFPLYGRTTTGGKHFLNDEPIHQTEFATDPQYPVLENDLVRLLSQQSKHKVDLAPLDTLRAGAAAVAKRLGGCLTYVSQTATFFEMLSQLMAIF